MLKYCTDYMYDDRKTKAKYVWCKYQDILNNGKILDVGCDVCHLKEWLPSNVEYMGIGLGGTPDKIINLETDPIPFEPNSFDTVLCLDVLEHLENIHEVFDQLCTVTSNWLIVSLPNPYRSFFSMLRYNDWAPGVHLKYYGLPVDKPEDRHKWFFSAAEAVSFVAGRAERNGMKLVQWDADSKLSLGSGLRSRLRWRALKLLFRKDIDWDEIFMKNLWFALKKMR